MKNIFSILSLVFLIRFTVLAGEPAKNITLAALFTDNMVLQQNSIIPVWGKAEAGSLIRVGFDGQVRVAEADRNGNWSLELPPLPAGGPYTMMISGKDTLVLNNILIGEVWLCSGQSNMAWSLRNLGDDFDTPKDISAADYPNLRIMDIDHVTSPQPLQTVGNSGWKVCSPATIGDFSAVAYYFGKYIHEAVKVPVGLINASYGGTGIEAWSSANSLSYFPEFKGTVEALEKYAAKDPEYLAVYLKSQEEWKRSFNHTDPGFPENGLNWNDPLYDDSDWNAMSLPCLWSDEKLVDFDGAIWFRKTIDLPDDWANKELRLSLGPVDDIDVTWFNGEKIGSGEQWDAPRIYSVPSKIVRSGKNCVAIRVLDTGGPGGIWGQPSDLKLCAGESDSLPIAGEWRFKIALEKNKIPRQPFSVESPNCPTVLFNGMINPLIPFAMRGVIWYQGENNTWNARQYKRLFPSMIRDWREKWQMGNFPFFYVQLANYLNPYDQPQEDQWAELREAQLVTLNVPNTGMAVAIDIGDAQDIHPKNKREVGRRLALLARNRIYHQPVADTGPSFKSMKREGQAIRLLFDHAEKGLIAKNAEILQGFAIAGSNRKFIYADARIEGSHVIVYSPHIKEPVAVRYAWAVNPVCNLFNKDGLPASPFRTDDWPGTTE